MTITLEGYYISTLTRSGQRQDSMFIVSVKTPRICSTSLRASTWSKINQPRPVIPIHPIVLKHDIFPRYYVDGAKATDEHGELPPLPTLCSCLTSLRMYSMPVSPSQPKTSLYSKPYSSVLSFANVQRRSIMLMMMPTASFSLIFAIIFRSLQMSLIL